MKNFEKRIDPSSELYDELDKYRIASIYHMS